MFRGVVSGVWLCVVGGGKVGVGGISRGQDGVKKLVMRVLGCVGVVLACGVGCGSFSGVLRGVGDTSVWGDTSEGVCWALGPR